MDEGTKRIELEILYVSGFVCPMFVNVVLKGTLVGCLMSYASTSSLAFSRFVLVIHLFEESRYPFYCTTSICSLVLFCRGSLQFHILLFL